MEVYVKYCCLLHFLLSCRRDYSLETEKPVENELPEIVYGDTATANRKMIQLDIPWPSLASSSWPMSEVNPQGLARSHIVGPDLGRTVWTKDIHLGKCEIGPAIGYGTIFLVMHLGFAALNFDGSEKWRITDTRIYPRSPPVVAADSTLYGGSYGFRAFRPDGSIKWEILTDYIFFFIKG